MIALSAVRCLPNKIGRARCVTATAQDRRQKQMETDDFVEPVRDLLRNRKERDYAMINLPRQKSLGRNVITNQRLAMIST